MHWYNSKNKRQLKKYYKLLIPRIESVLNCNGYACCVHGSMTRDLDICAVAWTKHAINPIRLAMKLQNELRYVNDTFTYAYTYADMKKDLTVKPHGRVAFSIVLGRSAYIDLSVIGTK